jgi:hypothetical protein
MSKLRAGKKRLFLWEHCTPVADIRDEVLGLPTRGLDQVSAILRQTRIVWVLREEGIDLGNTARPDPAATYRDAGVELCYAWEECCALDCRRHRSR